MRGYVVPLCEVEYSAKKIFKSAWFFLGWIGTHLGFETYEKYHMNHYRMVSSFFAGIDVSGNVIEVDFQPPAPLVTSLYLCDTKFHTLIIIFFVYNIIMFAKLRKSQSTYQPARTSSGRRIMTEEDKRRVYKEYERRHKQGLGRKVGMWTLGMLGGKLQ